MPTCIYCLESKPTVGFRNREHVLPQSFGRFRPTNLLLRDVVCDDCNKLFGETIELYLARDTPDGLNRYLAGGKNPAEFTPPRRSSALDTRVKSGVLQGAFVGYREGAGPRELTLLPQIGFGKSKAGPFKWFKVDQLPTPEQLETLLKDGLRLVQFCEIDDHAPVVAALEARGAPLSGVVETATGKQSEQRFEWAASLGMEFGRAITKIALNYLAHEYGAGTVLMAEFNNARSFVRHGGMPDELRIWNQLPPKEGNWPLAHSIAIEWDLSRRSVTATISFHNTSWYAITLGTGLPVSAFFGEPYREGALVVLPIQDHAHEFNLRSMTVRRIK